MASLWRWFWQVKTYFVSIVFNLAHASFVPCNFACIYHYTTCYIVQFSLRGFEFDRMPTVDENVNNASFDMSWLDG